MLSKILLWIPRIISILSILFVMVFSLDCFEGQEPFYRQITCFLIHNLPAFLLSGVLWVAWHHKLTGGILFVLCFISASLIFGTFRGNTASLIILLPFLCTGILFILHAIFFGNEEGKQI
jgi:hypothetical protein